MVTEDTGTISLQGLTPAQAARKRGFDLLGAAVGPLLTCWLVPLAWVLATIDTRQNVTGHSQQFFP